MCDERERLLDYLYDVCDAAERRRVDDHLMTCEECRDEISGLRAVRLDLQAWSVPEHDSVWKPFVARRVTPWWREVPAWGLATAAGLMFLLGLGGGFAARALAPVQAVQAATPQPAPMLQAAPVLTAAQTTAIEQHVLASLQAKLESAQPVAAHAQQAAIVLSPLVKEQLAGQMRSLIAESEGRQRTALQNVVRMLAQDSEKSFVKRAQFNALTKDLQGMQWAVTQALMQQQQGGRQ